MSVNSFEELMRHVGHEIECATYGGDYNVAIECMDCCEVLMDFDNPETDGLLRPEIVDK